MPSYLSFSSYTPVERTAYSPISPWIQNTAQKYRNDYTAVSTYKSPSIYTSIFDDIVSSGMFLIFLFTLNTNNIQQKFDICKCHYFGK